ncbi:MAG: hypothetical protein K2G09_04740 [Paramuribaculum sp.]|nr:hypothetical protein [Paramuribaculum sp.]
MTKDNLEELLEVTFEMEGLISLMIKREDMTPDKIKTLLVKKAAHFNELLGSEPVVGEVATPAVAVQEVVLDTPAVETPQPIVVETHPAEEAVADEEIAAATTFEETEDALSEAEVPVVEEPKEVSSTTANLLNDRLCKRTPAFTLNDKYRFRRALFDNNDEEFAGTLRIISGMKSMDEVEDYLYNDLCFESENEDVKAFVEIIAAQFA